MKRFILRALIVVSLCLAGSLVAATPSLADVRFCNQSDHMLITYFHEQRGKQWENHRVNMDGWFEVPALSCKSLIGANGFLFVGYYTMAAIIDGRQVLLSDRHITLDNTGSFMAMFSDKTELMDDTPSVCAVADNLRRLNDLAIDRYVGVNECPSGFRKYQSNFSIVRPAFYTNDATVNYSGTRIWLTR